MSSGEDSPVTTSEDDSGIESGDASGNDSSSKKRTVTDRGPVQLSIKHQANEVKEKVDKFTQQMKEVRTLEDQNRLYSECLRYIRPQPEPIRNKIESVPARNVLYRIALHGSTVEDPPESWVVHRLSQDFPELLEEGIGDNALFCAIKHKMAWFVEIVLDSKVPEETLRRILGPSKKDEEGDGVSHYNCITEAIRRKLPPGLIARLINAASEHTLAAQDEAGKTPLHHAVEYDQCKRKRFEVIEALLNKGDKAFDKRTNEPDCYSVYEYLIACRDTHSKSRVKKASKGHPGKFLSRTVFQEERRMSVQSESQTSRIVDKTSESKSKNTTEKSKAAPESVGSNEKDIDKSVKQGNESTCLKDTPPPQPKRLPTLPTSQNFPNEGRSLGISRLNEDDQLAENPGTPVPKPEHSKIISKPGSKTYGDTIAKLLKLHYLRSTFRPTKGLGLGQAQRDYESAERFLFGKKHGKISLCFTFGSKQQNQGEQLKSMKKLPKMRFTDFEKNYQSVVFDPVLLYVKFGSFDLEKQVRPNRTGQVPDNPAGKQDLQYFFKWLRHKKGVEHIIKVTVIENNADPHCDESIIKSLCEFDVEILDWGKVDLDPLVIQQASQEWTRFEQLHLQWSGNNAVLRAWSEREGLAKLNKLETIHIHEVETSLNSRAYSERKWQEFEDRLNESRSMLGIKRKVKAQFYPLVPADGTTQASAETQTRGSSKRSPPQIDEHQWLKIMDAFTKQIQNLKPESPPGYRGDFFKDTKFSPSLKQNVSVALIDDGVDFNNPAISHSLDGGKCFPNGFDQHDVAGAPDPPFHVSATEHGTNMAYQIQRICPAVKIYTCKIEVLQHPGKNMKANFTAKSAADAVEYAVAQGFDIISMSWTIKENDEDPSQKKHIERLETALKECAEHGKPLVFCSDPDIGDTDTASYYPFGYDDVQKKFKISAATAQGRRYDWSSAKGHYILPGHNVCPREGDVLNVDEDCPKTGSSVATALAAGLAALIIHCVRLAAIYNINRGEKSGVNCKTLEYIKKFDGMKSAFDSIRGLTNTNNMETRLGVEGFFEKPGKELQRRQDGKSDPDDRWRVIQELVRDLVRSPA